MDTSVSLTGCISLSYRDSDNIWRIFLQIIHAECFEYILEFRTKYKVAGVAQWFSPGHATDSLSLPKSYVATTEDKILMLLLFLHPIFLTTVCSKSPIARSSISLPISWTGYRSWGCFKLSLPAWSIFVLHWLPPLEVLLSVTAALGGHLSWNCAHYHGKGIILV